MISIIFAITLTVEAFQLKQIMVGTTSMLSVIVLNLAVPFFGFIKSENLSAVIGNLSEADLILSTNGKTAM
jgi:hypothetical protein